MESRIEEGEQKGNVGEESQPVATMFRRLLPRGIDQNYGAMATTMKYLHPFEQLKLQGLDKWWYIIGVSRVQWYFELPKLFYFADDTPQILAVTETGEQRKLSISGDPGFTSAQWVNCQVGRSRLFQACPSKSISRILKINSQTSFIVEKSSALPETIQCMWSLTNFKDRFIFLFFKGDLARRYSLAEDRWEEFLRPECQQQSACSLGDKVYSFVNHGFDQNLIHVLYNPGASISSLEMRWEVIEVPLNIVKLRYCEVGFVPLNSTEIVILGGRDLGIKSLGDVIIFNTSTCEFEKELDDKTDPFKCYGNQSTKVYENTIIALVIGKNRQTRLLKYTKGDTCITTLNY